MNTEITQINWYINPLTNNAVINNPLKLIHEEIARLTKEISQKELELLSAKNLLFSLKKQSREMQKCKFIAEGRVKHIVRGHEVSVKENSHPIRMKSDARGIKNYLENLPEAERLSFVAELMNLKN